MRPIWHHGPLARLDADGAVPVLWRVADAGAGRRHPAVVALIAHLAGMAEADIRLARHATGQPWVAYPSGWHVSLSGRGGHALIAAARKPVGVDRELVEADPPLWDMVTRDEARAIRARPALDWPREWVRRWTIKEAYAKLVGEPRRIAPEAIDTRLIDRNRAMAWGEGEALGWSEDRGDAIETLVWWERARCPN